MTRLLPPLHEGHAPFALHLAFDEALDAFECWAAGEEPAVELEGRAVPISSVFGRMRTCTDRLPVRIVDNVVAVLGPEADQLARTPETYSEAAIVMRALCVDRLRQMA